MIMPAARWFGFGGTDTPVCAGFRPGAQLQKPHSTGVAVLPRHIHKTVIGKLCQPSYNRLEVHSCRKAAAMPTRNVNLTRELDHFVATKVKSGRYENASEVVRAGLRTLEREEQQYEAKLAALRTAIDEGDASGIAGGDVFGRVRKALKLSGSPR
jgi:antitoxin ParD1/3/4